MKAGDIVLLEKNVPKPEEWDGLVDDYYYVHQESGKRIHEESYHAKVQKRNILAEFIEEIEPVEEPML